MPAIRVSSVAKRPGKPSKHGMPVLDWGLFNNRLTGSFDYFVRYTYDMIATAPELPSIKVQVFLKSIMPT